MCRVDTGVVTARILLDVIHAHGVNNIVLSPGSRNTPLLIGAAARHSLKKYVINDERTAAFTALGLIIATQKPVALICTSGTALYNYAPAIAEAYYQHLPLIVITADRPLQWINQESQTLRQPESLFSITKSSYNIPAQNSMQCSVLNQNFSTELEWYANRVANDAMIEALKDIKGPVHINIQFERPFNQTVLYQEGTSRIIRYYNNDASFPIHVSREISEYLLHKKILIIAGQKLSDHKLNKAIIKFSKADNVIVFAEPLSNLHLEDESTLTDVVFNSIDEDILQKHRPDIIISIGGLPVSEAVKKYIRRCDKAEHWTLNDSSYSSDNYFILTRHYDISPIRFFDNISSMMSHLIRKGQKIIHNDYKKNWQALIKKTYKLFNESASYNKWSETEAMRIIFETLPDNANLFISNGMIIRNAMNIMRRTPHNCWANRGVSGIDGTNATAFGASLACNGMTVLLSGDTSFSYCPEILQLKELGGDLRIIVINNNGGNIFRQVATTRNLECREEYFCNPPQTPIAKLAESYGWHYNVAKDINSLKNALKQFYSESASILEIKSLIEYQ